MSFNIFDDSITVNVGHGSLVFEPGLVADAEGKDVYALGVYGVLKPLEPGTMIRHDDPIVKDYPTVMFTFTNEAAVDSLIRSLEHVREGIKHGLKAITDDDTTA